MTVQQVEYSGEEYKEGKFMLQGVVLLAILKPAKATTCKIVKISDRTNPNQHSPYS